MFSKPFRAHWLIGLFLSVVIGIIGFTEFSATALVPPSATDRPTSDAIASTLSLSTDVQKTVLDNGLTVLTKEVHTAPVVSVQVWYRVGSLNEPAGENGISHQLEHLMFKGTTDRPIQFGRLFSALGSQFNAFTSYDMTAYFGTVERDKLEAMLTLEADRMVNSQIAAEQLESEKRVVISELQGYENSPDYRLSRAVMRAAFPDHPYGLPVGGTKADVESFTVEAVQRYYETYYTPSNATLVVAGDFDTATLLPAIETIFGSIPNRNGNAPAAGVTPTEPSSQPIVLQEPGSAALLQVVYPLVSITHPDVAAIDLTDLILTAGRNARLNQALIESGLASAISAYPIEGIDPGWYEITVTAAPGQSLDEIDTVLQQTLADLQTQAITQAELDRAKTQLKTYLVLYNQDITSQASQLGYYQITTGDYQFPDAYLAAIDQVTIADIQRIAQTYFDATKRTVGRFEPTAADGTATGSGGSSGRTVENFSPGAPVDPAEVARYLPPLNEATGSASAQAIPDIVTLNNGLRVLLLPDDSTPMVNLGGWIEAGSNFDPTAKAGLAGLTADNLMNGTDQQDALAIARTLEDNGASLAFFARREGTELSGYVLQDQLPILVQTLADVLQRATFPVEQLELSRQRALSGLQAELDDPQSLSWRVFRQTVYPPSHPFHSLASADSLTAITPADLLQFYRTHYRPDTTILSLVGNFDPIAVKTLLADAFSGWQAEGQPPQLRYPVVDLPQSTRQLQRVIPGKAESVTVLGNRGEINRQDPQYYAALVMNEILGGGTLSSRLGTEIRDRLGLTYGIYSFFQAGLQPGPFAIFMQTAPEDAPQAIDNTLALLQQIREQGVTPAEIEVAKQSLTSSYSVELADPTILTTDILYNGVYRLPVEEVRRYRDRINAVTPEQVQQAIDTLIHPDRLVIVTAGSEAAASEDVT